MRRSFRPSSPGIDHIESDHDTCQPASKTFPDPFGDVVRVYRDKILIAIWMIAALAGAKPGAGQDQESAPGQAPRPNHLFNIRQSARRGFPLRIFSVKVSWEGSKRCRRPSKYGALASATAW